MAMTSPASSESPPAAAPTRVRRARAFPRPVRFIIVSLLLLIAFLGFTAFVGFAALLVLDGSRHLGVWALAGFGAFAAARISAFVLGRRLTCPLCHGTVLHAKSCRKHAEASKLPLLSHRASVVMTALGTGIFRCMYCGTPFRLKR